MLLTDLANDLADALDETGSEPADADEGNDDDVVDDDADGDDSDDSGDTGDTPIDGAALFADTCAACHGADGASGFAPDISSFDADQLATGLELPNHAAYSLTEEDIAAIAEFLSGL